MKKTLLVLMFLFASLFVKATTVMELDEGAISSTDLLYFIDEPNGSPVAKKIEFDSFIQLITKLGIITGGVWNASEIDSGYLDEHDPNALAALAAHLGAFDHNDIGSSEIGLHESTYDHNDIATAMQPDIYDTDSDGYADPNVDDYLTAAQTKEQVEDWLGAMLPSGLTYADESNNITIDDECIMCFNIPEPNAALDIDIKKKFLAGYTITHVIGITVGGTNVTGRLYEVDSDGDDSDKVGIESSDWTFTSTETDDTSFDNSAFDAGDYLQWDTTSVSGEVTMFTLMVYGHRI